MALPSRALNTNYVVRFKQSVYDLAVQLYGDVSKVGIILKLFPILDTDVPLGSIITLTPQKDPIAIYFKDRGLIVCTEVKSYTPEPPVDDLVYYDDDSPVFYDDASNVRYEL
jgi:hypothetical protein